MFFHNWKGGYKTMMRKLERLQNSWNVTITNIDDVVSMHFVGWGEGTMRYIYRCIVPEPGHGDKPDKTGLNDMIKTLQNQKRYFAKPCPLKPYRGRCKGYCEIPCCGAYKRELFHTWRSQRNLRVHWTDADRCKLMNEKEMEDLIDKLDKILGDWGDALAENSSSDDDDDDDDDY